MSPRSPLITALETAPAHVPRVSRLHPAGGASGAFHAKKGSSPNKQPTRSIEWRIPSTEEDTISSTRLSPAFHERLLGLLREQDLSWLFVSVLEEVEQGALEYRGALEGALRVVFREKLEERDRQLVEQRVQCPGVCGKQLIINRRMMEQTWRTPIGPIVVNRTYMECRADHVHFFPLDAALKAPSHGEFAPMMGKVVSQFGVELPYGPGSRLLEAATGRPIDPGTIDDQTQRDGQTLHDIELEQADAVWALDKNGYPKRPDSSDPIKSPQPVPISAPPPPSGVLVMQADGAMINLAADPRVKEEREEAARKAKEKAKKEKGESSEDEAESPNSSPYRESLQIVIYRLADVVNAPQRSRTKRRGKKKNRLRTIITRKQLACVVNDPEQFKKIVNWLSLTWNHKAYDKRIALLDGSPKLWEVLRDYFHFDLGILDINHARGHIHECSRFLYGDQKTAKAWGKRWCEDLLKRGAGPLLDHLKELAKQTWGLETTKKLNALVDYVDTHKEHMNYPEFLRLGYPIASGAIEGINKHVMGARCKRSGQQFVRENAQNLLSLRSAYLDGRWDLAMAAVHDRQACRPVSLLAGASAKSNQAASKTGQAGAGVQGGPGPPVGTTEVGPGERLSTNDIEKYIPWRKQVRLLQAGLGAHIPGGEMEREAHGAP